MKTNTIQKIICVIAFMTVCGLAFADISESSLNTVNTNLKTFIGTLMTTVQYGIGGVTIVMLIWNIIKYFKGDGQSADSLVKMFGGLILAILVVSIVKWIFMS